MRFVRAIDHRMLHVVMVSLPVLANAGPHSPFLLLFALTTIIQPPLPQSFYGMAVELCPGNGRQW